MNIDSTRRSILAVLASLCFATAACGAKEESKSAARIAPEKRKLSRALPGVLGAKTAVAALEDLRARNRLTPDRRFVDALARLERLTGSEPSGAPQVQFDGRWRVRIWDRELAALPELPAFAELYAMVLGHAQQLVKDRGVQLPPGAEPDADVAFADALPTLRRVDQRWAAGDRTQGDALLAARAYVTLAVGLIDSLDVADALYSQALATTAFAEAVSGRNPLREKAALAFLLGYVQSAATLAQGLPADDPVRQFAAGNHAAVRASARADGSSGLAQVLGLRALRSASPSEAEAFIARLPAALQGTDRARDERESNTFNDEPPLRTLLSAVIAMREALGQPVAVSTELRHERSGLRAGADVDAAAAALGVDPGQLAATSESLLTEIRARPSSPIAPGDAAAAYFGARVFTGFGDLFDFYVYRLAAPERANGLVASFASAKTPLFRQFGRYARDLVRAKKRELPLSEAVEDIRLVSQLGLSARQDLFEPLSQQGFLTAEQRRGAAAMFELCDSRVDCRVALGHIAFWNLVDLVTDERLRDSALAETPRHASLRLRNARMTRDRDQLLAAIADRSLALHVRAEELTSEPVWLAPDDVRRAFEALLAEDPSHFDVTEAYGNWLIEQKDYQGALRVADAWLARKYNEHPLRELAMQVLRARAQQKAGQLDQAWATVEPLLPSMFGPALTRAAWVKSAAGDNDAALEYAERYLKRYPGPDGVRVVAEMLWRAGEPEEAADLIERWSDRLTLLDWANPIATAFADAFRDRTAEDGARAFAELARAKVDQQGLRHMVKGCEKLSPELAFRAYSQLQGSGYQRQMDAAEGYRMLERWQGKAAARKWIEQALPNDTDREPLCQFAYDVADDLIWDLVADPEPDNPQTAFIWLMRTKVYLRSTARDPVRKQRLDAYYTEHRDGYEDRMGLFLLGQLDREALWSSLTTKAQRSHGAYVLGLKAELDGDLGQAVAWYRITLEVGRLSSGEYQWASNAMQDWKREEKSLALLARDVRVTRGGM